MSAEAQPGADLPAFDLFEQPGHLIRRAQQISVAMFVEALGGDVTPVQYALLRMLQKRPGLDQVTLAQAVALDTSTTADIAARLEAKGWILREVLARRQRCLSLTPAGLAVLDRVAPALGAMNQALLSRLNADERLEFMRLLDWADSPEWAYGGGLFHIDCDYRLMIDNLMDLTHETFTPRPRSRRPASWSTSSRPRARPRSGTSGAWRATSTRATRR